MALDVFSREIRPGDLIAVNTSGDAFVSVEVVREDAIKPKTVNGHRSMKVIIITEEMARSYQEAYYKGVREYDYDNNVYIVDERPLTEIRDEKMEQLIQ